MGVDMKSKYWVLLAIVWTCAWACACSAQNQKPTHAEAMKWVEEQRARDACINSFRVRVDNAFDSRSVGRSQGDILDQIEAALPSPEKSIILNAARYSRSKALKRGKLDYQDWYQLLRVIRQGFLNAKICNKADPDSDMYSFADAVSAYLTRSGLDADEVFRVSPKENSNIDPLQQVLLALTLDSAEKFDREQ